jgi:hypothetical protein
MGLRPGWLATLLILTLIFSISKANVGYPLNRSPFGIEYHLLYRRAVQSQNISRLPHIGPVNHSEFETALPNSPTMLLLGNNRDNHIRFFTITGERIRAEQNSKTHDLFSATSGFYYQPLSNLGALVMITLDRERALDPNYTGKKWRGLAGDMETAVLCFKRAGLTMTLGRQSLYWGPQPTNLILSETAEPLDMFSAEYDRGRLHFSFLFARLDDSRPDSVDSVRYPGYGFNDNRYLAGHRLDIKLFRNFKLGLFETSLFGGEGRPPELYYLNPLQFFHALQLNDNKDDNTILGLDFTYLPFPGWSIYGQLIIDDFQIDDRERGDQEPDEIGWMAGLFRAGQLGDFSPDIKLEYVRITNRTYHQRQPRNRYLFRNRLLGHPLGCDTDSLSLLFRIWSRRTQLIELELAYVRHGEGSVFDSWDEPWNETTTDYSEPFPTGTVEKSFSVALRLEGYLHFSKYLSRHMYISLEGGYGSYKNYRNVPGKNHSTVRIDIALNWIGFFELGLDE